MHVSKLSSNQEKNYWNVDQLSKLVTPFQNVHLPVYRWYTYKHSFSRNLVTYIIDKYNIIPGDEVLDPFCGAGTTLLSAKERSIKAIGLDIMPLSILATNVKLRKYSKNKIIELYDKIKLHTKLNSGNELQLKTLEKYFHDDQLKDIFALKSAIMDIVDEKYRDLFLLCLLGILEESSSTRKDGAFLRTVDKIDSQSIIDKYNRKLTQIIDDLWFSNALPSTCSKALISDARKMCIKSNTITSVITSPPYPNRHDYTRIYLLELMVGFLNDYDEVKKLRYNLIRSHVEARERFKAEGYRPPHGLSKDLLSMKKLSLPNLNVITLVDGYFKDMYLVLQEMHRVLKKDGTAHIVIGDARYGGVNIHAGDYITEIAKNLGFEHLETIKARDKGNSPQQMGRFGKTYSSESIISIVK